MTNACRRVAMKSKMTLAQIAELTGVNASTVSRVLNRNPYVSVEVRQRVGARPISAGDVTIDYILDERLRPAYFKQFSISPKNTRSASS